SRTVGQQRHTRQSRASSTQAPYLATVAAAPRQQRCSLAHPAPILVKRWLVEQRMVAGLVEQFARHAFARQLFFTRQLLGEREQQPAAELGQKGLDRRPIVAMTGCQSSMVVAARRLRVSVKL